MAGKASVENGKKGGRPKGAKSQATLEREAVLAAFRQKTMESADILLHSQLVLARGASYLYKIEKKKIITGKGPGDFYYQNQRPKLVTSQWEIESYLCGLAADGDVDDAGDPAAAYYYIVTKDPNNSAIDSLLNRSFGKPTESLDVTSGGEKLPTPIISLDAIRGNHGDEEGTGA